MKSVIIVESVFCVLQLLVALQSVSSERVRRWSNCPKDGLNILNGVHQLVNGDQVAIFTCRKGFHLFGRDRSVCFGTRWTPKPPKCITNTCPIPQTPDVLKIEPKFDGSLLTFTCASYYKLVGTKSIYCNGQSWNDSFPGCRFQMPEKSCDFEDSELCGWTQDGDDHYDWEWKTGQTSTKGTGPSNDHTLGTDGYGHYMLLETSSPARPGHTALLRSPMYFANYSQSCFSFWYHIYGRGDIATFEVFVQEDGQNLTTLVPMFYNNVSRGDVWLQEQFYINKLLDPFQIVFFGTRQNGYRSDFAIDDVALFKCPDGSSPPETTLGEQPTTTIGTQTASIQTSASPTWRTSTTSTAMPSTTTKVITKASTKGTLSSSKQSSGHPFTSTAATSQAQTKHSTKTTTYLQNKQTTLHHNHVIQNGKVGESKKQTYPENVTDTAAIYVAVAVCGFLLVCGGIGVTVYCVLRKKSKGQRLDQGHGETNPLYYEVAQEEVRQDFQPVRQDTNNAYVEI